MYTFYIYIYIYIYIFSVMLIQHVLFYCATTYGSVIFSYAVLVLMRFENYHRGIIFRQIKKLKTGIHCTTSTYFTTLGITHLLYL